MRYRDALGRALAEEMERDDRVLLMGEEVGAYNGAYKVSAGLLERFGPERVIDTPIAENGFSGIAVGAAMAGLRPVVEYMTWNFSLVAFDQIINNAAKIVQMSGGQLGCPLVFRGAQGAGGALGSQHSQILESIYAHVPGMAVVVPATPDDAYGLLKSAIRSEDPVVFMEAELLYSLRGEVPDEEHTVPIGKAERVREGDDCTLISWGRARHWAVEAAESLSQQGEMECEVLDLRSLRPLDLDAVRSSIAKTHRAVVCHEGWPRASMGSELRALVQEHCFDDLDAPVLQVCNRDLPMPYAKPLEDWILPDAERIAEAARSVGYR